MRGTLHSGRIGSADHNDRNFDFAKAEHIDETLTHKNGVWNFVDNRLTFEEAEKKYYRDNFSDWLESTNDNYRATRHLDRVKTMNDIYNSSRYRPEETIFQIGDKDEHVKPMQIFECYKEYLAWHNQRFGEHVKILNASLHVDEATPHIQERKVWFYTDDKGNKAINQHKALECMGYTLPDTTQSRGRYNNLKQQYTAECREKWYSIILEKGIELETEPDPRYKRQNIPKNDYVILAQKEELTALNALIGSKRAEIKKSEEILAEIKKSENDALQRVTALSEYGDVLQQGLKASYEVEELLEKVTPLAEVLEDEYARNILSQAEKKRQSLTEQIKRADTLHTKYSRQSRKENNKHHYGYER